MGVCLTIRSNKSVRWEWVFLYLMRVIVVFFSSHMLARCRFRHVENTSFSFFFYSITSNTIPNFHSMYKYYTVLAVPIHTHTNTHNDNVLDDNDDDKDNHPIYVCHIVIKFCKNPRRNFLHFFFVDFWWMSKNVKIVYKSRANVYVYCEIFPFRWSSLFEFDKKNDKNTVLFHLWIFIWLYTYV